MAEIPDEIRKLSAHLADVHAVASDLQGKAAQMHAWEKGILKIVEEISATDKESRKVNERKVALLDRLVEELPKFQPLADEVARNAEILTTIAKS